MACEQVLVWAGLGVNGRVDIGTIRWGGDYEGLNRELGVGSLV